MRILNSLIVPRNVKGDPLEFIDIRSVAKYHKSEAESFGALKKSRKNSLIVPKKSKLRTPR